MAWALVGLSGVTTGCNNECDFFERCNGDVREVCGDGPDQSFNRKIRRFPCEEPSTVCIQRDEDHAACVLPGKTTCDDTAVRHCEASTLVSCTPEIGYSDASAEPARYLVGTDCEASGRTCIDTGSDASCVEP